MAIIEEKQIAKEILLNLIEKDWIRFEDYPEANNSSKTLALLAYKDILKTVSESD